MFCGIIESERGSTCGEDQTQSTDKGFVAFIHAGLNTATYWRLYQYRDHRKHSRVCVAIWSETCKEEDCQHVIGACCKDSYWKQSLGFFPTHLRETGHLYSRRLWQNINVSTSNSCVVAHRMCTIMEASDVRYHDAGRSR